MKKGEKKTKKKRGSYFPPPDSPLPDPTPEPRPKPTPKDGHWVTIDGNPVFIENKK